MSEPGHHASDVPEQPGCNLTNGELQVLALLAVGQTRRQIAGDLGLKFHAVTTQIENICQKLRTHERFQVAAKVLTEELKVDTAGSAFWRAA